MHKLNQMKPLLGFGAFYAVQPWNTSGLFYRYSHPHGGAGKIKSMSIEYSYSANSWRSNL